MPASKNERGARPATNGRRESNGGGDLLASTDAGDEVSRAVRDGLLRTGRAQAPRVEDLRQAEALFEAARRTDSASASLPALLSLVEHHPGDERLQIFAGRTIDLSGNAGHSLSLWRAMSSRFNSSPAPFRLFVRHLSRLHGREAALREVERRYGSAEAAADIRCRAQGFDELADFDRADAAFAVLAEREPGNEDNWLLHADSLRRRGAPECARAILDRGRAQIPGSVRLAKERRRLDNAMSAFNRHGVPVRYGADGDGDEPLTALVAALVRARRERGVAMWRSFVGPIMMLNGSLGPGGAERQFCRIAVGLQDAIDTGRPVAGIDVAGPLAVACRSLKASTQSNFFLASLRHARIAVWEYGRLPAYGGAPAQSLVGPIRDSLAVLPTAAALGTIHLTDAIKGFAPHVMHAWQDGTVVASALAALIAEVPRIVISFRGMPPNDRRAQKKTYLKGLYRALAGAPGVALCCNSRFGADRYAEWLEIDRQTIRVIVNGVARLDTAGDAASVATWRAFAGDDEGRRMIKVVGSVLRFDDNKQPLLLLDMAAELLAVASDIRLVLIGDGPLKRVAVEYAVRLGIADKVLFVGHSAVVGFWLSRMDVFTLLSKSEGLPNAIIEAQLAGVPVVATDVGGVREALVAGKSGLLVDPQSSGRAIASTLRTLLGDEARRAAMGARGAAHAVESFCPEAALAATVRTFVS